MDRHLLEALWQTAYHFLCHNQPEKALGLYRALHYVNPDQLEIRLGFAFAVYEVGDFEQAYRLIQFLESPSESLQKTANFLKSKCLWRMGFQEQARETLLAAGMEQP